MSKFQTVQRTIAFISSKLTQCNEVHIYELFLTERDLKKKEIKKINMINVHLIVISRTGGVRKQNSLKEH